MKILHITTMHPVDDDRIFERACTAFAREGHEVTLIASHERDERVQGVNIVAVKPRSGLARRIVSGFDAFRAARDIEADVYVFHDPDLIPWMTLLALVGRKVVFDIHENYVVRLRRPGMPAPLQRAVEILFRLAELILYQPYAGLMVTSYAMQQLYGFTGRPTLINHNTVDLARLKHLDLRQPKQDAPTIYTAGTNSPARNAMQTLEAMPLILKHIPEAKMIFVGRYQPDGFEREMEQRAAELGVQDSVEILGMLPWDANFERTARMHVGCVFYEDNPNNRVTLPNRLFEYMACGVAILGHDFPEIIRIVREYDCGEIVDSADPESIADGAVKLLRDRERLAEMGEVGRRAIDGELGYHREVQRMSDFFQRIAHIS